MAQTVLVHEEPPVARLVLNRPEVYNAVDLQMASALAERLASLACDDKIRAVVISGAGSAFCAGGDLNWIRTYSHGAGAGCHLLAGQFHVAINEIRSMGKPVIAAINGVAAGGGFSLALACDFRAMAEGALLRQAYTSSGLCIDCGGTFTLPRLVGLAKALEIAALDSPIDAKAAQTLGLVGVVASQGECENAAMKLAGELVRRSMNSFAWSKTLFNNSFETGLQSQLERERAALVACANHPDGAEGLQAFAEKRKPKFSTTQNGAGD